MLPKFLKFCIFGCIELPFPSNTTPNLNPLSYGGGPITRSRAKRIKEAIIGLVQVNLEHRGQDGSNLVETKLVNLVSCVQDDTHPCDILHACVQRA